MYRKIAFCLLCMCILVSCSHFSNSETAKLNKVKQSGIQLKSELPSSFIPRELNIVAAGDSLTLGVGSSAQTGGYIPYLESMLEQGSFIKKVNFANFGVKGNKADQLLARLSGKTVNKSLKDADIIILTIGGNDLMQVVKDNFSSLELEHFVSEREDFRSILSSIFEKIRISNDHAPIVLIGLYNPFFNWFADVKEMNEIVDEWNYESLEAVKRNENSYFIDIHDIFLNNEENLLAEDYFHPNDRGYQLIADRIYELINVELMDPLMN